MALIPWRARDLWTDPFRDLEQIQREVNRLFDFSLSRREDKETGLLEGMWTPAVDIFDSKDNILVRADLPGLKKEDIDISVRDNVLTIKGEKKQEKEVKEKEYVRTERFYGSFHSAMSLPAGVDESKVTAAYKNGVLEITLPKKEEAKPKQIKVDVQ